MISFLKKHISIILVLICLLNLSFIYGRFGSKWVAKANGFTIVLDAGHGGLDVK